MKNSVKFSIIIPVYNVEKYLEKCLSSVVNQYYQNYEAIIVCDKCTDDSEKIVDDYVKKYQNFKKIYAENTGLAIARNLGVKKATGDYLLFLDGDDYLNLDLLEVLANAIKEDIDLIRFQVQNVSDYKVIKYEEKGFNKCSGVKAFEYINKYHYIESAWCYCYSRCFYLKNKFKFMDNCIAEDYGLIPLIINRAENVISIEYIGYNYVQRNESLMNNNNYDKKIKKLNDMLKQADYLIKNIPNNSENKYFLDFTVMSVIYFNSTLNKEDYIKYNKVLKENHYYDYLLSFNLKKKIKKLLIKLNSRFYFKNLSRYI